MDDRSHSPNRSGIDVGGVNHYLGRTGGAAASTYAMPTAAVYGYASYPQAQAYATPPAHSYYQTPVQLAAPQMPIYSTNASGLPVNVGHGAYLTEARGIFISNLDYNVGPIELGQLLQTVGRVIVDQKMHNDPKTGQFKGLATAQFATKSDAVHAVQVLNNTKHMNKTIHVRLDTDTTVVGSQGPVIVNGSNVAMVSLEAGRVRFGANIVLRRGNCLVSSVAKDARSVACGGRNVWLACYERPIFKSTCRLRSFCFVETKNPLIAMISSLWYHFGALLVGCSEISTIGS